MPLVSVVVPVLNEGLDIERLLGDLLQQTPPAGGFEVVVVDGGSTDATRRIAWRFARMQAGVHVVDNQRRLASAGRNLGVAVATGRYVVFLDGHCMIPRMDYLVRLVEIFETTAADCLSRPQPLDRFGGDAWSEAIAAARHSPLGHDPASDIYGGSAGFTSPLSAGAAYVRERIEDLGGYDERFDACEDMEFNCRLAKAGMRAYLHPDLAVYYRPRSSLEMLLKQMIRYGRGRARVWAKHPREAPWYLLVPTTLLLATGIIAWAASGRLAAGVGALIAVAWVFAVARASGNSAGLARWRIGMALVVIQTGLLLGFWRGLPEYMRFRRAGTNLRLPSRAAAIRFLLCSDGREESGAL